MYDSRTELIFDRLFESAYKKLLTTITVVGSAQAFINCI
jgi:hypothetical protein